MILSLVLSRSSCDRLISARSLEPRLYLGIPKYKIEDKESSTGSCHYLYHRYLDKNTGYHFVQCSRAKEFQKAFCLPSRVG